MKKIITLAVILLMVFSACEEPKVETGKNKLPNLIIRNNSSFILTDVKFSGISFSVPGSNDLPISENVTKPLKSDDLNKAGYIYFVRKDIGIALRTEAISIGEQDYTFTFLDSTMVEEVGNNNSSNRNELVKINFLSNLVIEKNGSFIPDSYNVNLGEAVINFPVNDENANVFTIKNSGVGDLLLTGTEPVKITGSGASAFSIIQQPVVTNGRVSPGGSVTFKINFIPTAEQIYFATVTIQSNNKNGDFSFTITATGVPPKPIAHVFCNNLEISNEGLIDTDEILITQSKEIIVVIRNSGAATLVIQNNDISITGQDKDAFIKTTNPSANVPVNGQTSFRIECKPYKVGENNAVLTIPNNDISRDPIIIHLKTYGVRGTSIIELTQSGKIIENNTLTTMDFGRVEIGTFQTMTFTIKNTGNINLNLPAAPTQAVSSSNPVFIVQLQPANRVLLPGSSTTFIIRLQPSAEAEVSSFINIENDSDEGLFSFIIKGTGYIKRPHINIQYEGMEIQQNATIDAGEVLITQARNITVLIKNTGEELLSIDTANITITGTNSSAFLKSTNPTANISVNAQSSFVIRCEPLVEGDNTAILTIPSNDINRNPITVFLKVTGVKGAPILELHQDTRLILNNSVVPFDFGQVTIGSGGFKTFAFTIKNTGNIALNLTGNPIVQSDNLIFSVQNQPANTTLNPSDTTTFIIRYMPSAEKVDNASITILNNSHIALFTLNVTGSGYMEKPLIKITHGTTEIAQNGTIDAGDVLITTSKTITITMSNHGDTALNIDVANITITGTDSSSFTRSTSPGSSVQPNNSTSFNVEFSPKKQGESNAVLSIPTNDPSRNPVVINLKAAGIAPNALTLTANTWADGNITTVGGVQWFRFTATSASQYIHSEFGTLTNILVQLFDESGNPIGVESNISSSITNIIRTLNVGQQYYIKIRSASGSGTYKIGFNTSFLSPGVSVTSLTSNTWTNGNIATTSGSQWFSFSASTTTHYIYASSGTLANVFVQIYDSSGNTINSETIINSSNPFITCTTSPGILYYVRTRPSSGSGTFNIAYNASFSPPGAVLLAANTWADGNIASAGGVQWFKFTATAQSQYIHVDYNTLSNIYAQVYDSNSSIVQTEALLYGNTKHFSRPLTVGQEYFIRVRPSSSYGTYKIAFNTVIGSPDTISLTANSWADGNITSTNLIQWFKFTATTATQCIHIEFGTSSDIYLLVYDNNGNTVGSETRLNGNTKYIARTLTQGQEYYIRVTTASTSRGTYRIGYNSSVLPPGATSIKLTGNTWSNGSIAAYGGWQWFNFTATAETQYIHSDKSIYIQLYDDDCNTVGAETNFTLLILNTARSLTVGQQYLIRVRPYVTSNSIEYKITFSNAIASPDSIQMTPNTWINENKNSDNYTQWFYFIATAENLYIHYQKVTSATGSLDLQLYDSNSNVVGSGYSTDSIINAKNSYSYSLVNGQIYYIKIQGILSSRYQYRLAFNTSTTSPP